MAGAVRPRQSACPGPVARSHSGHMTRWSAAARLGLVAALAVAAACRIERAPSGRPGGALAAAQPESLAVAEVTAAVKLFYRRLTVRDWNALTRSFWPRATVTLIMRPPSGGPEAVQVIPIEDVVAQSRARPMCPASMDDQMVRAAVTTYGPLADAWVTYRLWCGVRRGAVTTHYGVDAFHLLKHRGEWRITGLTFQSELPGQPLEHAP